MITEAGMLMRAAERYGRDPITWPGTLTAGQKAQVLAQERIRSEEENRWRELAARAAV